MYGFEYANTELSLQVHLPDEECPYCGSEFPASKINSHQKECWKMMEGNIVGNKRKLEPGMKNGMSGPGLEHDELKTESTSSRTKKEKGATVVGEHQTGDIHQQSISIKYNSSMYSRVYSVKVEPVRKMERVMRKLAMMVDKQIDKLMFEVEGSEKVITGEEIMGELAGKVIVMQNV